MSDDEARLAAAVRREATEPSDAGRAAMRNRFESAVRGDLSLVDQPARSSGRQWLMAAAALLVVMGGTVTVLATRDDDRVVRPSGSTSSSDSASIDSSLVPPSSVVESTVAQPTTSVGAPAPTTVVLPALGELPYASVDAQLPTLVAGAPIQVGPAGDTPAWMVPWPEVAFVSSAQSAPQGWLLVKIHARAFFEQSGFCVRHYFESDSRGPSPPRKVIVGTIVGKSSVIQTV